MNSTAKPTTGRRIGIVTYDYDPPIGGLGVLVQTYEHEMKKQFAGDVYTVISPSLHADNRGSWLGSVRYRKSGGCPLFSVALFFSLPRMIRKHSLHLIHVHSGSGGVFLLRKPMCKLVVTAHHTYRQEADFVFAQLPLKRLWKLFMARLEARTYHLADAVICVSRDTADAIITQYGIPPERVSVIENPVQVPADSPRDLQRHADTVLFVGRLEARKGALLLLEAFSMLLQDIPTARLRLIGSNLLGSQFATALEEKGMKSAVECLGFVPNAERFREMSEATVLVVPSTLEGFGLVAAEAMMLGTCVVASDAPGLRSVITHGRTGVLFPVADAQACADAMKQVLMDGQLRAKLAGAALTEAPIRFNVESRSHDVSKLYDRVLHS